MRDLYEIFDEMEKSFGPYRPTESEDYCLPFDKILEIVEAEESETDHLPE